MALPLAAIAAGAGVLSSGINAITTGSQNRKDRDFAREQYATQRRDALADWQMTNEYNSPAAAMERYKAAGLNPNLIYGQPTNNAATARSSSASNVQGRAPQFDFGSTIGQAASIKNQETQNELMQKDADIKDAQVENIKANTRATLANAGLGEFNLDFKRQNSTALVEQLHQTVAKLKKGVDYSYTQDQYLRDRNRREHDKNMREHNMAPLMRNETRARIKNLASQREEIASRITRNEALNGLTEAQKSSVEQATKNLLLDWDLKKYEKSLNDAGLDRSSPWYQKTMKFIIDEVSK